VLAAARYKTKREVEQLVAALRPRPDVPSTVRKLPAPASRALPLTPSGEVPFASNGSDSAPRELPAPARPARVTPLAPERYNVQFTVGPATHDKLRRVQDLLRHQIPNGDPALVFDRALTVLLEQLERTKIAAVRTPRSGAPPATGTRHIPAAVKRAVWTRDGGRCAFVGSLGQCRVTGLLEFHHVVPYAAGGAATVGDVQLRGRQHNVFEADCHFGSSSGLVGRKRGDHYG
jgi:hypothetical protein